MKTLSVRIDEKEDEELDNIAKKLKTEIFLLDDEEARIFARKLGIKVSGTLGILIELLKRKLIGFIEAQRYLKKINDIMYLSSDVYCFVENILKKIAEPH